MTSANTPVNKAKAASIQNRSRNSFVTPTPQSLDYKRVIGLYFYTEDMDQRSFARKRIFCVQRRDRPCALMSSNARRRGAKSTHGMTSPDGQRACPSRTRKFCLASGPASGSGDGDEAGHSWSRGGDQRWPKSSRCRSCRGIVPGGSLAALAGRRAGRERAAADAVGERYFSRLDPWGRWSRLEFQATA